MEWIISEREREGEEFGKDDETTVLCFPILSLSCFVVLYEDPA